MLHIIVQELVRFTAQQTQNQMLMEIMGLHLPGSSFVNPYTELRDGLTVNAVEMMLTQLISTKDANPIGEIVSENHSQWTCWSTSNWRFNQSCYSFSCYGQSGRCSNYLERHV